MSFNNDNITNCCWKFIEIAEAGANYESNSIFTESALRPIQSESRDVRPSVRPSVCVSEIYFEGPFAPTYESHRPTFFVTSPPLGSGHVTCGPMRGLKINFTQTYGRTDGRTSRLSDWIGLRADSLKIIPHTSNTVPSRMCVIQEYQYYIMCLGQ